MRFFFHGLQMRLRCHSFCSRRHLLFVLLRVLDSWDIGQQPKRFFLASHCLLLLIMQQYWKLWWKHCSTPKLLLKSEHNIKHVMWWTILVILFTNHNTNFQYVPNPLSLSLVRPPAQGKHLASSCEACHFPFAMVLGRLSSQSQCVKATAALPCAGPFTQAQHQRVLRTCGRFGHL